MSLVKSLILMVLILPLFSSRTQLVWLQISNGTKESVWRRGLHPPSPNASLHVPFHATLLQKATPRHVWQLWSPLGKIWDQDTFYIKMILPLILLYWFSIVLKILFTYGFPLRLSSRNTKIGYYLCSCVSWRQKAW
jgi:hypothetical protein